MCSLILKPDSGKKKNIVFRKINEWLGIGSNKYVAAVTRTIKHPRRVLSAFGMVLIVILLIHRIIPTSFLPVEDQGYFKIELELPGRSYLGANPCSNGTHDCLSGEESIYRICAERDRKPARV